MQLTGSSETGYRVTIEEKRDGPRLETWNRPSPGHEEESHGQAARPYRFLNRSS
jgi:hypothetical protein